MTAPDRRLDGAGDSDGGQEGAYAANAAEFAARWNAAAPDFREVLVRAIAANSQAAIRCLMQDHDGLEQEVQELTNARHWAAVRLRLTEAERDSALAEQRWVIEQ